MKNTEARDLFSLGPKFRITTNDIELGLTGPTVYSYYSYNDNNDTNLLAFTESGSFYLLNDRGIEIAAGGKQSDGNVDINITALGGDITITACSNGTVKIKGKNIMIEAIEDVDIKAGRNITMNSGSGRILLKGNKVDAEALTGNLAPNPFGARCFSKVGIGDLYMQDVFTKDPANIIGL